METTSQQQELGYGKVAGAYDGFLTLTGFKRGVERFLDRVDFHLPAEAKILDAGCGTGLIASYLARRFPTAEITAFDIDDDMLRAMERAISPNEAHAITIAKGDLSEPHRLRHVHGQDITIAPGSLDAVFASGALEHVELEPSVARLTALLKPGGIFFNLGVRKNPAGAVLGMVYKFKPYSTQELHNAASSAGLEDIRTLRLSVDEFPANLSRVGTIARKQPHA